MKMQIQMGYEEELLKFWDSLRENEFKRAVP